jgi:hypothetical protein
MARPRRAPLAAMRARCAPKSDVTRRSDALTRPSAIDGNILPDAA